MDVISKGKSEKKRLLHNEPSNRDRKILKTNPPETESATMVEVIHSLKALSDSTDLNKFADIIKNQLEDENSDKGSTWNSFTENGDKFLNFMIEKGKDENDFWDSGSSIIVEEILRNIGNLHWAVGGLAIAAHLIRLFKEASQNKARAFELISNMVDLVTTVIEVHDVIEKEKLKNAIRLVVRGYITCYYLLDSSKFARLFKAKVHYRKLEKISKMLHQLYRDLQFSITAKIIKCQEEIEKRLSEIEKCQLENQSKFAECLSEIGKRRPKFLPVPKPIYPKHAVGIENALKEVTKLLNMTAEDQLVVIIYGDHGIGKTTLANAVISNLNLDGYHYARVHLDEHNSKNDLMKMQHVILQDILPSLHWEDSIQLRDCQEGQDRLTEAFRQSGNKPIFLFIDNALRLKDLKELLPEDLSGLPKNSRIFITTRNLDATDVFLASGLRQLSFHLKMLEKAEMQGSKLAPSTPVHERILRSGKAV